jgi:hypothetical protein
MTDEIFADALAKAQKELEGLMTKRSLIDARIAKLSKTIRALTEHLREEPSHRAENLQASRIAFTDSLASIGITDAVR